MRATPEKRFDHSGGVQAATSWLLRAQNEVEDIVNGRFDDEIGVITRILGYLALGNALVANKPGLGLYEAKFSTGSKIFGATNKIDDTATEIRTRNTDNTWTLLSMPTALTANTEINMASSLDEAYIAGMSATGSRMTIVNVKNDLSLSETRNLIGAPKARFICEYGGRLHAINVELGGTVYPDRTYQSSLALGVITYTRGLQNTLSNRKLYVDSVRYLKPGMAIDIYNHVTNTIIYTNLTIASVDKGEDSLILPVNASNTTFTADTTDVITVSSMTAYPTGTPVTVTTTGTLPGGLLVDTVYYIINSSATTGKLATTAANATAGTAVDITSVGSGTHTLNKSYVVADNDEIYLTGRYGQLTYLWNTDYPSVDKADFFKIPSGAAANSAIVSYAKSNNRLFLFTDSTIHRWDKSQLIPIFEDIGCANHRTVVVMGDWVIWLDADKRVNARNDSTGQHEFISRAIKKKYLNDVPAANLTTAAAGKVENIYKLCLGSVNGKVLRVCYDFDSNNWSREESPREMRQHVNSKFSGSPYLYFLGEDGKFYRDNTGNDFDGEAIPFKVIFGKNNSGTSQLKDYSGWYVFGQNMSGIQVRAYMNGRPDPIELKPQLEDNIATIEVGQKPVHGRYISLEISHSGIGDPIAIEGYEQYSATVEDKFGGK